MGEKRILFTWLGVPWVSTSATIPFMLVRLAAGLIVAWLLLPDESLVMCLVWGVVYGVLMILAQIIHTVGHIVSSRQVAPPMREARFSLIGIMTLYPRDDGTTPANVHLMRSVGGPAANILVGVVVFALWALVRWHPLSFFAVYNILLGAAALLPLPMIDGGIIWREVGKWIGQ